MLADAQYATGWKRGSPVDASSVDEGPVGRPEIFDHDAAVHDGREHVPSRNITVGKDDLQLRIAACGHRSRPKLNPSPGVAPLDRDEIELSGFADRPRFAYAVDARVNCRGGTREPRFLLLWVL